MYKTCKSRLNNLSKRDFDLISEMSHASKNLFNVTLYTIRQHFFETSKYLNYESVYHQIKTNENYKFLPSQTAQQTMKIVDSSFKSFFSLLKKKQSGKYDKKIKIPNYLDLDGYFILVFTKAHSRIDRDSSKIKLSIPKILKSKYDKKYIEIDLPGYLKHNQINIKEIRINPVFNGKRFDILFVYENNTSKKQIKPNDHYLSIDLGVSNFATCYDSLGQSFILDGKHIKSINRYFNKLISKNRSITKHVNNQLTSRKIQQMWDRRNSILTDYLHKSSRYLVNYCVNNNISKLVVGYNKNWKQSASLGKTNNQNFVQLPYSKFIEYLKYKAKEYGIELVIQEESYTSKTSCLDNEDVSKHETYQGIRISRGLFKSGTNLVINADLNGAINILRKYTNKIKCKLKSEWIESSGTVLVPVRIRSVDRLLTNGNYNFL